MTYLLSLAAFPTLSCLLDDIVVASGIDVDLTYTASLLLHIDVLSVITHYRNLQWSYIPIGWEATCHLCLLRRGLRRGFVGIFGLTSHSGIRRVVRKYSWSKRQQRSLKILALSYILYFINKYKQTLKVYSTYTIFICLFGTLKFRVLYMNKHLHVHLFVWHSKI